MKSVSSIRGDFWPKITMALLPKQNSSSSGEGPSFHPTVYPISSPEVMYNDEDVQKLGETTMFEGYRNIIRRDLQLPTGQVASYDILTQRHLSVVVFAWNSTSSTATLIREFHPGAEKFMYGTVAGMYEFHKHKSALEAAVFELEEEAQLKTEKWIPLLDEMDTSMPFDKYSTNRFFPFMALDCDFVQNSRAMDPEELITIHHGVTYKQLLDIISKGDMNVVSTYTILLGVRKLNEMGIRVD